MKNLGFEVMHVYGLTETYGHVTQCAWNNEWNAFDEDKQNVPNMPNFGNMGDNFMPLMNQMMNNTKIKEKLDNQDFREKMMRNQSNPLAMLGDPDMRDFITEMMNKIIKYRYNRMLFIYVQYGFIS